MKRASLGVFPHSPSPFLHSLQTFRSNIDRRSRSQKIRLFCSLKRNGDDKELESLKIMQSAIERYLNEKNYSLGIVHPREFHNLKSNPSQNYTSCTFKFLFQRQLEVSAKLQNTRPLNCVLKCCYRSPTVVIINIITVYINHEYTSFFRPLRDHGPR